MDPLDELMHSEMKDALDDFGVLYGRWLAEFSPTGSVVAIRGTSACGECRYTITIATNDAADHLLDWSNEQIEGRRQAAKKAGHTTIDYHGEHRPSDS